ncbi:hypothetical protein [Paenibacillus sp. Y412MC10]|uniref:hypothetical protein n=1 Tax=Geobacillus sp. (strain Y412MC10) TaxID=481743 RepID=UPI0011AB5BAD|nr:hypothetical protein [Paenibacillus sp. Y412MC10]
MKPNDMNEMDSFNQAIDIHIDGITPCLTHRLSGENYKTTYQALTPHDIQTQIIRAAGWVNFDWSKELSRPERLVFKLQVVGSPEIQGLISLRLADDFVFVHLVENAPWNVGSASKQFIGVGAHLFAIACKISFDHGFEGYVSFEPKTVLFDHYIRELGAQHAAGRYLVINTAAANRLVTTYFPEEGTT